MERYDGENGITTDDKGIARGESQPGGGRGPSIAWFRDPSGNILSVLERRWTRQRTTHEPWVRPRSR